MSPDRSDSSRLAVFEAATHRSMMIISLAVIPVYVGQALTSDASTWVSEPLRGARLLIHLTMALDVGVRTYFAPRRLQFLAHHPLDLFAVAVPPVRALREVVALRTILLRPGLVRFTAVASATIAGCALVVYATEHDQPGADIQSLGDAFWWAAVTATTVGYGDEVPVTNQGRAMALLLMVLGITLLSVLTAHVAAYFVDNNRDTDPTELLDRLSRLEATLATIDHQLRHLSSGDKPPLRADLIGSAPQIKRQPTNPPGRRPS